MSALISSFTHSRTENSFARLKSTFEKPGPTSVLRPASPKLAGCGFAKAAGLNHIALVGCDTFGLPTRSGYRVDPLLRDDDRPGSRADPSVEPCITGVNGTPECHWKRVE